jgi:4-hydroxy-tetrahydrodipicolinate synthase
LNLPWLAVGAAGLVSVTGHVAGSAHAAMVAAVDAGDLAAARAINDRLIGVVQAIMSPVSQGAIRAKAALQAIGVLDHRTTRLPLLPASDDEVAEVRAALESAGLVSVA